MRNVVWSIGRRCQALGKHRGNEKGVLKPKRSPLMVSLSRGINSNNLPLAARGDFTGDIGFVFRYFSTLLI
jgi:hypothetical protein